MEAGLLQAIANLVLCSFNPANPEKQKSFGKAEHSIIKLFKVLAPGLQISDRISDICEVIL